MNRKSKITNILNENLNLHKCVVSDVSNLHKGHIGYIDGEQTHLKIIIISNDFKNKSKLERHKIVNKLLKDQFKGTLHSISFKLMTKEESGKY